MTPIRGHTKPLCLLFELDGAQRPVLKYKDTSSDPFWRGEGGTLNGPGIPLFQSLPKGPPKLMSRKLAATQGQLTALEKYKDYLSEPQHRWLSDCLSTGTFSGIESGPWQPGVLGRAGS